MVKKKMTFEEAKTEFIKKLNGRDLAEYTNDLEKEENKKLEELYNDTEYMKIWKEDK